MTTHAPHPTAAPAPDPTAVAAPVVRVRSLVKRYEAVTALDGLDLTVPPRSVVGFLGPNGAGKTTAMRILTGLARRTTGEVSLFGMDPEVDGPRIRSRIGFLAQEPRFYEHLTPRETLTLCLGLHVGPQAKRSSDRIDEVLARVGIADAADRPVRGFSGGQRQRLGIAQAMVHEPELLIMDEPAAALDPAGRASVLEILQGLRERTTILFSTHILDDVQRIADRVTIVSAGRTVTEGSVEELRAGTEGVRYDLRLRGPVEDVVRRIEQEPWATRIDAVPDGDVTELRVVVSDPDAAEASLLRRALEDPDVRVAAFGRHASSLERVFLDLIARDGDVRREGTS